MIYHSLTDPDNKNKWGTMKFFLPLLASFLLPVSTFSNEIGSERAIPFHLTNESLQTFSIEQLTAHGQLLFEAKFTTEDGVGRPMATSSEVPVKQSRVFPQAFVRTSGPDANACRGCHNDPVLGGAGEFAMNVFASEGINNPNFTSLDAQFSNERGTPHLFGVGLVELLAREMTRDLQAIRDAAVEQARNSNRSVVAQLETKGIQFGEIEVDPRGFVSVERIDGVDFDLVVRPFNQKGVFNSLRQFSINAMNTHHGMQSDERFGERWTHETDFDEDGVAQELTPADISALVVFQARLPAPEQVVWQDERLSEAVDSGEQHFVDAGCAECHRPELPLESLTFFEPGPYNSAGTLRPGENVHSLAFDLPTENLRLGDDGKWYVPLFSDLKRHVIADAETPFLGNERLSQRFIPNEVFITPRLWGVGSTAPYGHRGDVTTMREIIFHHGGDAKNSRVAFESLPETAQLELIEFLKSLRIQ